MALNKRRFLKWVLSALAILIGLVIILASTGALLVKSSLSKRTTGLFETTCDNDKSRILVAYASKYRATSGIAETIGETLCTLGASADVKVADQVDSLDGYSAVIIGSPIYYGKWLPGAQSFLERHQDQLAGLPVAYFISCNTLREGKDTPPNQEKAKKYYVQPILEDFPQIKPHQMIGLFGGKMVIEQQDPFDRLMMRLTGYSDNDSRNLDKVAKWAREVGAELIR